MGNENKQENGERKIKEMVRHVFKAPGMDKPKDTQSHMKKNKP